MYWDRERHCACIVELRKDCLDRRPATRKCDRLFSLRLFLFSVYHVFIIATISCLAFQLPVLLWWFAALWFHFSFSSISDTSNYRFLRVISVQSVMFIDVVFSFPVFLNLFNCIGFQASVPLCANFVLKLHKINFLNTQNNHIISVIFHKTNQDFIWCYWFFWFCDLIMIIFISSAALSKIRHAAGARHSVVTKRCAFRSRAKVAVDSVDRRSSAGKLFQVSGPETAKFLRPMAVAVRCTSSFSGGGRLQVLTSCEMNDLPAELSEIEGC